METLRPKNQWFVACVGCENLVSVVTLPDVYVMSNPVLACSAECLEKEETKQWMYSETRAK